jgi:G3E family GTPase
MIPVTLITGFLGSGKTTLINRILKETPDSKISIILNEFGDTKLESQFITAKKGDVVELSNGCMCCIAQNDFERVIKWILSEKPETEHIIIEASGLSDPLPIASTLAESELNNQINLETIVCVIDAVNFFEMKDKYSTLMVQLSNSDVGLITKSSQADKETVTKIESFITNFLPRMQTYNINQKLPLDIIFSQNFQLTEQLNQYQHTHEDVDTLFWKSEKPLDFHKLNNLLKKLPSNIVRVKGVINIIENGVQSKILLQYVGSRSEVTQTEWQSGEAKQTALLFLGKEIDEQKLTSDLNSTVK